jgi:hypothetical protein
MFDITIPPDAVKYGLKTMTATSAVTVPKGLAARVRTGESFGVTLGMLVGKWSSPTLIQATNEKPLPYPHLK